VLTYSHGLHDVPAKLRLKGEVVNYAPPPHDSHKSSGRNTLSGFVRQFIALLLHVCHLRDLAGRLAQTHSQIVRPVIEAGYADSDFLRGALDLNGELLSSSRISNEVSKLRRARPPHEFASRLLVSRRVLTETGVRLDATFADAFSQFRRLVRCLPVFDVAREFPGFFCLAIDSNLINLFKVFFAFLVGDGFAVVADRCFHWFRGLIIALHRVLSTKVYAWYPVFPVLVLDHRQLGLYETFEIGDGLLGVDEERKGFDVFAVRVHVSGNERKNDLEHARGRGEELS
jgi:hypothetical protein